MQYFRLVSFLEGLSYLAILGVSIGIIDRVFVFPLGMAHGVLFILYFLFSIFISYKQRWTIVTWLLLFFASIIPFAFIAVENFLRKNINAANAARINKRCYLSLRKN